MSAMALRDSMGGDDVTDPFALGLFGGLPKTETQQFSRSTNGTTAPIDTATGENASYALALAKRLFLERPSRRQRSYGVSSSTTADSKASIAPCSEMKGRTSRLSLSDRLTPSLITAGLVKGIIPTSIRHMSDQPIRVFAFARPVGDDVARPKVENSCLSGGER